MSERQPPQARPGERRSRSKPVRNRLDSANRTVLLVLALALGTAGVLALLLGIGQLFLQHDSSLVAASAADRLAQRPWLWWVGAGAALVLALLGLWWLVARLRTDGVAPAPTSRGRATTGASRRCVPPASPRRSRTTRSPSSGSRGPTPGWRGSVSV